MISIPDWQIAAGTRVALFLIASLLTACSESERPDDKLHAIHAPAIVRVVPAKQALAGTHIPELDPATMNDSEIQKVLGEAPHCLFRYTSEGKPVLAIRWVEDGIATKGVVKLNGALVELIGTPSNGDLSLNAGDIRMTLAPDKKLDVTTRGNKQETDMVFAVGDELKVGYRGYFTCHPV